ncbi:MAG: ComF family protein [Actinomycetota bacterium]|nr:ComF family protein [Actinomycetota bacterium]
MRSVKQHGGTFAGLGALADLLYPERCLGCERLVRGGICADCLKRMPRLGSYLCSHCGRPTHAPVDECRDCRGRRFAFDAARQRVRFEPPLREAVHRFKYSGCASLGAVLGRLIIEAATFVELPAMATWVPASRHRLRQTGVDHGRRLAEMVGATLAVPAAPLLVRVRETPPQSKLDPAKRRRNLRGAFAANPPVPESVGVIDDVFTTGATASEAARALKAAGAVHVTVLCAARAMHPDS